MYSYTSNNLHFIFSDFSSIISWLQSRNYHRACVNYELTSWPKPVIVRSCWMGHSVYCIFLSMIAYRTNPHIYIYIYVHEMVERNVAVRSDLCVSWCSSIHFCYWISNGEFSITICEISYNISLSETSSFYLNVAQSIFVIELTLQNSPSQFANIDIWELT